MVTQRRRLTLEWAEPGCLDPEFSHTFQELIQVESAQNILTKPIYILQSQGPLINNVSLETKATIWKAVTQWCELMLVSYGLLFNHFPFSCTK